MKKAIAMILALGLLSSTPVYAEDRSVTTSSAKTILSTTIDEGYTVMIPATLEIPFNQVATSLSVQVTELHLNQNRKLEIFLNNPGSLTNGTGGKLGYALEGKDLENGYYMYFTELGTKEATIKIPSTSWKKAPAGTYTSTMPFQISIVNDIS